MGDILKDDEKQALAGHRNNQSNEPLTANFAVQSDAQFNLTSSVVALPDTDADSDTDSDSNSDADADADYDADSDADFEADSDAECMLIRTSLVLFEMKTVFFAGSGE